MLQPVAPSKMNLKEGLDLVDALIQSYKDHRQRDGNPHSNYADAYQQQASRTRSYGYPPPPSYEINHYQGLRAQPFRSHDHPQPNSHPPQYYPLRYVYNHDEQSRYANYYEDPYATYPTHYVQQPSSYSHPEYRPTAQYYAHQNQWCKDKEQFRGPQAIEDKNLQSKSEAPKKKRGRPPGSKNRPTKPSDDYDDSINGAGDKQQKKGAAPTGKVVEEDQDDEDEEPLPKKRRNKKAIEDDGDW